MEKTPNTELQGTFHIVRHCHSECNKLKQELRSSSDISKVGMISYLKEKRYAPIDLYSDTCLSQKGIIQAEALSHSLEPIINEVGVFALSPCRRIRQTFELAMKALKDRNVIQSYDEISIVVTPLLLVKNPRFFDLPLEWESSEKYYTSNFKNCDLSQVEEFIEYGIPNQFWALRFY